MGLLQMWVLPSIAATLLTVIQFAGKSMLHLAVGYFYGIQGYEGLHKSIGSSLL